MPSDFQNAPWWTKWCDYFGSKHTPGTPNHFLWMVKERIFFRVPRFVFFTTNLFLPRRRAPGMTLRWRIRSNKDMARPDASQKVWRSVVGVKENEGSIYQGAASCNESHLKKKSVSVSVSFFPPLVCMKIQSTNKVSAKKNQRIMAAKSRWKIAIFLTFRKVIPPKKTTSALTESLNQFFSGFRWNLGSLVTYIFGGDV